LPDPAKGGLWLGFAQSGVAYFKDHQVRASYERTDGLGEGFVSALKLDADGTLWAATQGGLSHIRNGRVTTLSIGNGLPCSAINGMLEDDEHFFWLYTPSGLVRIARSELDLWAADQKKRIQATVFDNTDGVRSRSTTVAKPAKSADGKI